MSKYYVTTAIPYINGEPHLGHAMEFVIGDVLARQARKTVDKVLFSIGTDEHGGKIAEKAKELGITPKELADKNSKLFVDLAKKLDLTNDRFIRTTDEKHIKIAQDIWKRLHADIYKNTYKGWYCLGDEAFFTEKEVKATNGICPNHNRPYEMVEEENYFFALSKYSDQVLEAITSNKFKIYPETKKNEILGLIKEGLEDISISRPQKTNPWGIPVPDDDSQVMYVWFEAVINYLSVLGYPDDQDFKTFWPPNAQVIGKDIIRFHAAILPAMLLGLGEELTDKLYVHGFVNADGQKMSKSIGNVVSPIEILAKYGSDPFRYYFLRHIPSYSDGDFSWAAFNAAYEEELANELGNALSRTVAMTIKYLDGQVGSPKAAQIDTKEFTEALDEFRFDKALSFIWKQIKELNQYIDETKPWVMAKTDEKDKLKEVLSDLVSRLLVIADLLEPFLPQTAKKMQESLSADKLQPLESTLFPKDTESKNESV